MYKFTLGDT